MELPVELRNGIDSLLSGFSAEELKKISRQLTDRYKNDSGRGKVLVSRDVESRVYAAVRMPATFGAISDSLSYVQECMPETQIRTVLDVGAGSGSGAWAVEEIFSPEHITCLEREESMRSVGNALLRESSALSEKTSWAQFDLSRDPLGNENPSDPSDPSDSSDSSGQPRTADLVLASYMLNEFSKESREKAIRKLWNAADHILLIVEPGTKEGFAVISQVREILLSQGAHLLAPCPHEGPCRLSDDDWCHFTCRVQRSKLHKLLKEGDVPYEDEKYSYIAFSKEEGERAQARILRHPYITKGQIDLEICGREKNGKVTLRKKDEAYKAARKAKMGDAISNISL